jgi:hypothetical protein
MEPRRRNPLRRYPTAVCISVWHFGLTQSKTRALNSPGGDPHATGLRQLRPEVPLSVARLLHHAGGRRRPQGLRFRAPASAGCDP